MATITMDATEYEALKKNIELLEDSKKREKELNDEISKLQQESIDKLINAENSVSVINKTVREDNIYTKRDDGEIYNTLEYFFRDSSRHRGYNMDKYNISKLIHHFFTFERKEVVLDSSVVTKGFDEVRKEVEEKYLNELSSGTQKQLDRIPVLEDKIKELNKINLELGSKNTELSDIKEKFHKTDEENLELNKKLDEVNWILKSNWGIFNYSSMKEKLEKAVSNNVSSFIKNHKAGNSF